MRKVGRRAPHTPHLNLGRSPLRTASFKTPPGPGSVGAPGLVGSGVGVPQQQRMRAWGGVSRLAHARRRWPGPGSPGGLRLRRRLRVARRRGGRASTPGGRCRGEVRAGGRRRALRSVSQELAASGVAQGGPGGGGPSLPPGPAQPSGPA